MSSLLSYIGWAFLPNYTTSILQNVFYGITIRAGDPRPQPGTARFDQHRRRIFMFVVSAYLLYTLYESFYQVQATGDFYGVLGVSPLADDRTIKSRFRRLAAQHHPDKVSQNPTGASAGGDGFFVYLKLAQDTLLDPTRRFAYDRFGPSVNEWRDRQTALDFLYTGLQQAIPQYIFGLGSILVLNMFYWSPWGRYWRWYTFAALVTLELVLITRPQTVFIPTTYLTPAVSRLFGISIQPRIYLLPFQIISLGRRISVTIHIFISQVTPAIAARQASPAGEGFSPQTIQRLSQLLQLARRTEMEATGLLNLGLVPFKGDPESVAILRRGMKEGLVLGSVRGSPEVQEAVAKVLQRKTRASSPSED